MKKLILITTLMLIGAQAHAVVKCKSLRDPNFVAYFEGYSCPPGYYQVL